MRDGIRVGRLFGVDVTVGWSWFFVAALAFGHLTWTLWQWHADWGLAVCVATGLLGTLMLFVSILAHELGHALVAEAQGLRPRAIRFFLFGAATQLDRERSTPLREGLTAAVGPAISLVLGALLLGVAFTWSLAVGPWTPDPVKTMVLSGPGWTLLMWSGSLNVLLGLFNLIPAFPLDGGRIFRSLLWGVMGDVKRATRAAAIVSQVIAGGMMALGLVLAFASALGIGAQHNVLGALWLVFIGWFLLGAASHSYRYTLMEEALEDVPVGRLTRSAVPTLDPEATVSELVQRWMTEDVDRFVVVDGHTVRGVVDARDARRLPREEWDDVSVGWLAHPIPETERVPLSADGRVALQRLTESERSELLVFDGDRPVGVLRWRDVMRWLELQSDDPGLWRPAAA